MTPDPLVLEESLPVRTAALLLFHYEVGGAPVTAADGALVGVLSEADLLEKSATPLQGLSRAAAQAHRRRSATIVGEACSRPALTTAADTSLRAAARLLRDERVGRLVVVDASRIAGILTRHHVLRALLRSDAEIAAAIDALLEELDQAQLHTEVEWGAVRLDGTVSRRSLIASIIEGVEAVDGVVSVDDSQLVWAENDLHPPYPYLESV